MDKKINESNTYLVHLYWYATYVSLFFSAYYVLSETEYIIDFLPNGLRVAISTFCFHRTEKPVETV